MATRRIEAPDIHFLNSAIGWLELGNQEEAKAELDQLSVPTRFHPDVLLVRWKVLARIKNWVRSLVMARALARIAPDKPTSWICLAYSLYKTQQSAEAWRCLLMAEKQFPTISAIPYFLACLACQLGKPGEATQWLARWNGMVHRAKLKAPTRKDPRFQPIWQEFDDVLLAEAEARPASPSA